jgi:hypothetical protein
MLSALFYAVTGMHPDLAYLACYLSQFASAPGPEHLDALQHVFHYLAGTSDYALFFDGSHRLDLVGYCDSDWAGDPNDHCSVTGQIVTLGGSPIYWGSKKQPTVALSSTEGEYMAATETACSIQFIRQLLKDIGFCVNNATVIHMDNQSAIQLALNMPFAESTRTKHIDTRHHWI